MAALAQGAIYKVAERCSAFQLAATVTNASCYNSLNGIIDLDISGGQAPYSFQWNVDQPDSTIVYLNPGTYTVEAQDAQGCIRLDTFLVEAVETPPPGLALSFDAGTLSISAGMWTAYQWLLDGNPIPGATAATYTPAQDGLYECQLLSANGCTYQPGLLVVVSSTALPASVSQFSLAPNPTSGSVRIGLTLARSEQIAVSVQDGQQRQIFTKSLHGQRIDEAIDLSLLPAGTYYLSIRLESGNIVRPVVRK